MSKRFGMAFSLILLFLLSSCNPFTTNLYSSFDKFQNPDLTDVDEILAASDEPQFYENLANDPDAKAQVLATLSDVYNDPDASEEKRQDAAIMAADVYLKTSDTEEVMSNLNSLVGDAVSGEDVFSGSGDSDGPEVFFRSLFGEPPEDIPFATYKATVVMRLDAFKDSAAPLEAYGETRESGAPIPIGLNTGDTATKALMAGITRTIIYYLGGSDPVDDLATYLATPKVDGDLPDGLDYASTPPDYDGPSDMLVNPLTGSTGLVTVVNDGLDLDSLMN
jgi:hypothetical protein